MATGLATSNKAAISDDSYSSNDDFDDSCDDRIVGRDYEASDGDQNADDTDVRIYLQYCGMS